MWIVVRINRWVFPWIIMSSVPATVVILMSANSIWCVRVSVICSDNWFYPATNLNGSDRLSTSWKVDLEIHLLSLLADLHGVDMDFSSLHLPVLLRCKVRFCRAPMVQDPSRHPDRLL